MSFKYNNSNNSHNNRYSYNNRGRNSYDGSGGGGGYRGRDNNNNNSYYNNNNSRKERFSDGLQTERNNSSSSSSYYKNNNNNNNNNSFPERPPPKQAKQGNQMERPNQVIIPEAVTIVNQLVIGLGNFTEEDTFSSLGSNIVDVAELLVEQGDLSRYPDDISNLFVKCFCQLILQTPAIATLLAVISRSIREFPELVLEKLITQFLISLKTGDVLVAKNLFRVLACLASTNTILLNSPNDDDSNYYGFFDLLGLLCDIAETEVLSSTPSSKNSSISTEAAIFILTSCIPYYAQILYDHENNNNNNNNNNFISRIIKICRYVAPISQDENTSSRGGSKYDVTGSHAIFHVSIEGTTPPNCANDSTSIYTPQTTSPSGAVCWDSLWEICRVGDNILTSICESNGQSFTADKIPKCLLITWLYPELQESLQKDVAKPQSSEDTETNSTHAKLSLKINLKEIKDIFFSTEFIILSGPISDCHLPALIKTTDSKLVTERQKYVSNASSGYSSWIHLRFNIWDEEISADSVQAIKTLSLLELTTARDYYRSVLRFFEPFIRDDGTRVGSMTLLYQHLNSISQFFPENSHMEYLLMETLLLLLLQIPSLNSNLIQRITLELCTKSIKIPPILVSITSSIYELIPALDISAWRELSTYLSIHLANTNLQWPYWDYWSEEYSTIINSSDYKENGSLQKLFLELLIGQCSRLSLPERVAKVLPNNIHSIIPSSESEYMPYYVNFSLESGKVYGIGQLSQVAEELINKLNQREISNDVILKWLQQSHNGVDDAFQNEGWRLSLFIEGLFCRCALNGGTITGMIGIIDRYRDILLELILSYDEGYQILVQTLCSSLHHQCALLSILIDTLMRRGLLSPTAIIDVFVGSKHSIVDQLHIDYLHSNQWVWKFIEIATDRCLDIVKAATSIQNNEAFKQIQQQKTDMDVESENKQNIDISVVIPENISEAVDTAAESSRELYQLLVTKLLWKLQERHQHLVLIGQESPNSSISGVLTSLDPGLVSIISLLTRTIRVFHLTEKGLKLGAVQGTNVPSITARLEVSVNLLNLSKFDSSNLNEDQRFNRALELLSGPAKRVWEGCIL